MNEIATNALQHGGRPAMIRGWTEGAVLVVQVEDRGGAVVPPHRGLQQSGGDQRLPLRDVARPPARRRRRHPVDAGGTGVELRL